MAATDAPVVKRDRSWAPWRGRLASRGTRAGALIPVLIVLLLAAVIVNVGVGAVAISPVQAVGILLDHAGISTGITYSPQQDAVLWAIRLPRVLLALLVGAGLGLAGAALQGVFRNPLAEPALIGVSSGASVGAVASIIFGFTLLGRASLPLAAFAGALLTTLLVYATSRSEGRTPVETLILMGIAVNAVAGALTGYLTFLADDQQLRSIVFWSLGSLGGATWEVVRAVLPFIGLGLLLTPRWGRALNLLVLGEREARHLGLNTERTRFALIALAALMTGAAVAVAGIIGFVGLVVPHLVRLIAGPDHRLLLPASALGGALLLLLADLAARTLVTPAELPLGVVTALLGGPFFMWLLYRAKRMRVDF